jgi:hypothetical protein
MMAVPSLSDLTKMPVMPKLPKTQALTQPKATPEGMIGPAEIGPVLSELGSAESEAALKVAEGDIAIKEAERQDRATEARMKAENLNRFSKEVQAMPERATLQQAREEMSNMAFVPTKDTATDLAAMFSLINIVGMLVGKNDAQRSMYAMNGMLEGYQKGRADLYKKEQIEFDKNFKAMQTKIATLEKALTDAMEVKKYDKEKGELLVTMALAESDSQVLKAMRVRQGDNAVLENVRRARTDMDKLVGLNNTLAQEANRRADAKAAREQQDRIARENRLAADERAKLARLDKEGRLSPKERGEVRGINNLTDEIQRLKDTFKPEFANFGADVIGDTAAKFQARFASNPEMANWWRRYENVALPERHSMFGATLTGNEAKSWRKASIGAGSSTEEILSWIGDKERVLTNKLADYETTAAARPSQGAGDIEQDAIRLTKSYEPDIYEYGYENGKFFRDLKEKK